MTEKNEHPTPLARPPQRPWLRAFLLTSVVFISGLIVGVVLTSAVLWKGPFNPLRQPAGVNVGRLVKEMQYELLLTPEQSEQIKTIVSSYNAQMKAIRDEVDPKIKDELQSLKKQVESVLTSEQAKRWNARYDDMQRRFMNSGQAGAQQGPERVRRAPDDRQGPPPPRDDARGPDDRREPPPQDNPRNPRPGDDRRNPPPRDDRQQGAPDNPGPPDDGLRPDTPPPPPPRVN